jgi:hypothetical protein
MRTQCNIAMDGASAAKKASEESHRVGVVRHGYFLGSTCISPLVPRLAVPTTKAERQRAFVAATFYSECSVHGIPSNDVDLALRDADKRYRKWWIDSTFQSDGQEDESQAKRRRTDDAESTDSEAEMVTADQKPVWGVSARADSDPRSQSLCGGQPLPVQMINSSIGLSDTMIRNAKAGAIASLRRTRGDTTQSEFLSFVGTLESWYSASGRDESPLARDGTWLTLSKPTYSECRGKNNNGEYRYSLGRLSFDMFRPTGLVCSIQASLNVIQPVENGHQVYYPSSIQKEVTASNKTPQLRKYE